MKFPYKKKHQRLNLGLAFVWFAYFLFKMFDDRLGMGYVWLFLSVCYFGFYFYGRRNKYLTIEDGVIKENWPFGKSVKIDEITNIRYFAGDYTLTTREKEMKINTHLLDQDYFLKLKEELEKIKPY